MSNKNLTPMQAAAATARNLSVQLRRVYGCEDYAAIAEGLALFLDEQATREVVAPETQALLLAVKCEAYMDTDDPDWPAAKDVREQAEADWFNADCPNTPNEDGS